MDLVLVDLGIDKDLADGVENAAEEGLAGLLETSTGKGGVEVDTLEEGVDLNGGLVGGGEGTLGKLASSAETTKGTRVTGHVWKS